MVRDLGDNNVYPTVTKAIKTNVKSYFHKISVQVVVHFISDPLAN